VFPTLTNGEFSYPSPLFGWTKVGGDLSVVSLGPGAGNAALLSSDTTSTKWMQQAIEVVPGAWYAARASIRLVDDAAGGWLRIAWYASPNAAGAQLEVVDSPVLSAPETIGAVETGPVRAPADAHSARVRLMLRPASALHAALIVDDVRFDQTAAPRPTPTPTPRVTATPSLTATPSAVGTRTPTPPSLAAGSPLPTQPPAVLGATFPTPGASPQARPARQAAETQTPQVAEALASGGRSVRIPMLRVTELLPDPVEPGADADHEWIEIANVGHEPADMHGVLLADNQGAIVLPAVVLGPRQVLVIAGARAVVPEGAAYWPPGGFSNGLANGGDRLVLYMRDGTLIDALSYGSDATYDRPPLVGPDPGKSLVRRFADDGTLASVAMDASPSPGILEEPVAESALNQPAAATAGSPAERNFDGWAWITLALIAVGVIVFAAIQRYRAIRSGGGAAA
jgi:hypothetical protein